MFIDLFLTLRKHKVPVSLRELLDLIALLKKGVVFADVEAFYHLAKIVMVKDEIHYDKFDGAFAEYFDGVQKIDIFDKVVPDEWLRKKFESQLSQEEKDKLKALGGLDELMKTLKERLAEQEKRHEGGNKWVGTGGKSPFGAYGYHPEGIRVGQDGNRNNRAVKVWDKREFRNFDQDKELGTRNIKLALKKLRKFARTGASEKLDINTTIRSTAKNGGLLDVHMEPERHNSVKVLMFFDIGGSMDEYIHTCEELFSAAHTEFKHLEFFYFHNCVYESLWKDNSRRRTNTVDLEEIIRTFGSDYKVLFVGDATMGPYEIIAPGGSVEHWNKKAGIDYMQRILGHFNKVAWLNPQPENQWDYHQSISIIKGLIDDKMFPLTVDGIGRAIKEVS
ncbi:MULTISPECIES: VWA domain-containing protein [unclassified Colwellia]|uniref:vWA domain-containing protein n=1 Tax=unclassified Colwellia TaxID=196834 RepID=UPI0015F3E11C|nr:MULTISPECIES: VWA domain-containing protein [unclassified Colwellia]MBA6225215.1 VWA domain-containing protein [Colwellia sp. MB3u-45]MBA6266316.1 VWA domain-containing protein [Colwellia sp. MB3u-43]MBA6288854.1 VWA domain-containing protein [Colwellia sp. MB3u-4]MBA6297267.1 VWA domain-containing protein [Colwellia sp. MB02u-9]MBA6322947.1 VWA domain-containing protein [Colwellia sp. MB02u-19]